MSTESPLEQWGDVFFWALMILVGVMMLLAGDNKIGLLYGRIKANARIAGYVWIFLGIGEGGLRAAVASGWTGNSLPISFAVTAGCLATGILLDLLHNRRTRRKEAATTFQPSPPQSPR